MHVLYSVFSERKKQQDALRKEKKQEGGLGDLAETHSHMEMVCISVVAGNIRLALFFFIFDLLRPKIGSRLALRLLNLRSFTDVTGN